MKTIEEKAKAYDELTAKLKEWHNGLQDDSPAKEILKDLLPQFRESEDEKIRKELLEFVSNADTSCVIDEETQARWFNYLQRQKDAEAKHAGMIVVSQEEWNSAIADAFKHGIDEGKKQNKQNPYRPSNDELEKAAKEFREKNVPPIEPISDELIDIIKDEFEGFRNLLKKKGIDYEPQRGYWEGFARLFDSSAREYVKKQKAAESCSTCVESEHDKGYREGVKYALEKTGHYTIGNTFMGLIPCWVNAPSELQPAHKYHGRNAVIMHENNGGFRCCFIDDKEATTVGLPEDTSFVEGWRKKPAEWNVDIDSLLQEQPIKVYRVENEDKQKGLWRKFDGTWEPLFDMLTDGLCRNLPMEDNDLYRAEGKKWFASAPSRETLRKWFSKQDLEELTAAGFTISEFEVTNYKKVSEFEYIFTRDSIINRTYLAVSDIYPEQKQELISISEMVSKYRNTGEFDDDGHYEGKPINCMIRAYKQGIRDTLLKLKEQKSAGISSLRDWKFIVDAVLTEHEGIGQYLDNPETERIAKKLQKQFGLPQSKPAEWNNKDKFTIDSAIYWLERRLRIEKANNLLSTTGCYLSMRETVERLQHLRLQPKPSWNEEDEKMRYFVMNAVESRYSDRELAKYLDPKIINEKKQLKQKLFDWLRCVHRSWKPSKEQIAALKWQVEHPELVKWRKGDLESLLEQLKKLM